ncbi:MAG: helix-turn-helix transcriptional regulator [Olsenella sp.]|nr:helix-turn-helix transcriptional regulator [Olsenella sp.]
MRQDERATGAHTHMQHIARTMGRLREARGLTIAELARRADMDPSHLGKVLRGERNLQADEYLNLCYVLGAKNDLFVPTDVAKRLAELNMRTMDGRLRL